MIISLFFVFCLFVVVVTVVVLFVVVLFVYLFWGNDDLFTISVIRYSKIQVTFGS